MNSWPITISLPRGLSVGGVATWAVRLAEALGHAGREARLVAHAADLDHEELQPLAAGSLPKLELVRAPSLNDPSAWHACLRVYRDLAPTVLLPFTLGENYAIAAALATVCPERIRVVGWNHSDNPYDHATLSYYEPLVHRFVGVSRRCVTELGRRMPNRADAIEHLPYGVFVPPEQPRPPLSRRPLRLIYGGRMDQANKRVFDLVTLATLLDQRGVRFELRLVGDGPQAAELRERIDAATPRFVDQRSTIRLEPPVPHYDMPKVWSWADVSLLASRFEGFSVAMVESMACGCVPVVSRVRSGVADILEERRNGLTFPIDDIAAAADRVEWLSKNESQMRQMSRAARQAAEASSGYDRFFGRAVGILDGAIAAPERPWPAAKPLHMNSSDAPSRATVPCDAPDRLRRLLKRIAQLAAGPIAIYGAGYHTRALASVWADSPVQIAGVIDDDPGLAGKRLWGWPVVRPQAAHETGARSVVISSWLHESEIWQRQRAPLEAAGLRVFRLYAASPLDEALSSL